MSALRRTRVARKRFATALTIACVILTWRLNDAQARDSSARKLAAEHLVSLEAKLDPDHPGRGVLDYPGEPVADVPKAYAAILKGEVLRRGLGKISPLGTTAGTFLIVHADERNDGFAGWGVPAAWDAYGDGSVNPIHTKYTISSAVVVDALLDWIDADGAAPRKRVLGLVRDALKPYATLSNLSPSGLLPYSLEPSDRKYDTFNPAAYLAGLMQRYSRIERDPLLAAQMRQAADKTVAVLLAQKQLTADKHWFWHYSITEKVPNDLAHASYIMRGLRLYAENGGALAAQIDLAAIEGHLQDFYSPERGVLAWPVFRIDANNPARSYDLGMGMLLVCTIGPEALRRPFVEATEIYKSTDGRYLKYPVVSKANAHIMEYEAYVFMGLNACAGER